MLLGGRAAEEVIYGRDTSKASVSYLADATWLARKMITVYAILVLHLMLPFGFFEIHSFSCLFVLDRWNLENPMTIHGEPLPWRKSPKFVGPRLDFEGSLYDDYDLIEPPLNFDLDDDVSKRTEALIRDTYAKTLALLRQHHAALLKTVKVWWIFGRILFPHPHPKHLLALLSVNNMLLHLRTLVVSMIISYMKHSLYFLGKRC